MSFNFHAIDHVQLAAPKDSEDIARGFFKDILGFDEIEKPEALKKNGGVWFASGDLQLHIGIEEPFVPAKKAHPAFEVHNIKALKKHLLANDITVTEDDKLPGASRFYISDPFGNRIELLERNQ